MEHYEHTIVSFFEWLPFISVNMIKKGIPKNAASLNISERSIDDFFCIIWNNNFVGRTIKKSIKISLNYSKMAIIVITMWFPHLWIFYMYKPNTSTRHNRHDFMWWKHQMESEKNTRTRKYNSTRNGNSRKEIKLFVYKCVFSAHVNCAFTK